MNYSCLHIKESPKLLTAVRYPEPSRSERPVDQKEYGQVSRMTVVRGPSGGILPVVIRPLLKNQNVVNFRYICDSLSLSRLANDFFDVLDLCYMFSPYVPVDRMEPNMCRCRCDIRVCLRTVVEYVGILSSGLESDHNSHSPPLFIIGGPGKQTIPLFGGFVG